MIVNFLGSVCRSSLEPGPVLDTAAVGGTPSNSSWAVMWTVRSSGVTFPRFNLVG